MVSAHVPQLQSVQLQSIKAFIVSNVVADIAYLDIDIVSNIMADIAYWISICLRYFH